uniref:Uncharacterized protein n=1 Tax=Myoviridae sp. ctX172 TaxID=2826663 RepID=A0A8S5QT42_9CAUD|nr:MAG TPA: hypothetical protein [Myoviridae sp. ctX172]DAY78169.1 MAG TPA: hypothetical protein [Caudoviricetes sp.]
MEYVGCRQKSERRSRRSASNLTNKVLRGRTQKIPRFVSSHLTYIPTNARLLAATGG